MQSCSCSWRSTLAIIRTAAVGYIAFKSWRRWRRLWRLWDGDASEHNFPHFRLCSLFKLLFTYCCSAALYSTLCTVYVDGGCIHTHTEAKAEAEAARMNEWMNEMKWIVEMVMVVPSKRKSPLGKSRFRTSSGFHWIEKPIPSAVLFSFAVCSWVTRPDDNEHGNRFVSK